MIPPHWPWHRPIAFPERSATPPLPLHHGPDGFRNSDGSSATKTFREVLRWRREARRAGVPRPPTQPTPQRPPDLAFLQANAGAGAGMLPSMTWIGHASALLQFGGLNVLVDPVFSGRASPLPFAGPKRQQPPGIAIDALPHIDLVLITHNHYDHLDDASVRRLAAQPGGPPEFVVPLGLHRWMAARGLAARCTELDWWQAHGAGPVEVVHTPSHHWSARGLTDRCKTLWGGYALFASDFHVYVAGDTGYSKDFVDIRERLAQRQSGGGGFDLALLPIGAYEPRWFMKKQHVDPAEAVQIYRDVGAKRSIGLHWGTFSLTDESLDAPPQRLARECATAGLSGDAFTVMAIGETRRYPRRGTALSG